MVRFMGKIRGQARPDINSAWLQLGPDVRKAENLMPTVVSISAPSAVSIR